MDGLQTTVLIREKEESTGQHIPIFAMTAHALKGDRERCLNSGMDGYLSKPIQMEKFYEAISHLSQHVQKSDNNFVAVGSNLDKQSTDQVIDRADLLSRFGDDTQLLKEIFGIFQKEYKRESAAVQGALASSNSLLAAQSAHTLKGVLANLSAPRAMNLASRMEILARSGDLGGASTLLPQMHEEVGRVQSAIAGILETVSPS